MAGGQAVAAFDALDDCIWLLAACQAADAAQTAAAAVAAITAAAAASGHRRSSCVTRRRADRRPPCRTQATCSPGLCTCPRRPAASTPARSPQTCGKVERHHQTLERWLAAQPAPARHPRRAPDAAGRLPGRTTTPAATTPPSVPRPARLVSRLRPRRPGHLPRQDDATVHALTVAANGFVELGIPHPHRQDRAGQAITAIRDHDRVTIYTPACEPLGHIRLDHHKRYQGTITPPHNPGHISPTQPATQLPRQHTRSHWYNGPIGRHIHRYNGPSIKIRWPLRAWLSHSAPTPGIPPDPGY